VFYFRRLQYKLKTEEKKSAAKKRAPDVNGAQLHVELQLSSIHQQQQGLQSQFIKQRQPKAATKSEFQ